MKTSKSDRAFMRQWDRRFPQVSFTPGKCFENAARFAAAIGGTYVEGVLQLWDERLRGKLVLHAWVEKSQTVYDPTWNEIITLARFDKHVAPIRTFKLAGLEALAEMLKRRGKSLFMLGPVPEGFAIVRTREGRACRYFG